MCHHTQHIPVSIDMNWHKDLTNISLKYIVYYAYVACGEWTSGSQNSCNWKNYVFVVNWWKLEANPWIELVYKISMAIVLRTSSLWVLNYFKTNAFKIKHLVLFQWWHLNQSTCWFKNMGQLEGSAVKSTYCSALFQFIAPISGSSKLPLTLASASTCTHMVHINSYKHTHTETKIFFFKLDILPY